MKRALLVLVAVLLVVSVCWAQAPKGQEVSMTGMMTCAFCNLPEGGKCSKDCCQNCIKNGDAVLLTTDKGAEYLLLSSEMGKPLMTPDRMDMLMSKVTVKGMEVKRGGLQAIYVKEMQKAK